MVTSCQGFDQSNEKNIKYSKLGLNYGSCGNELEDVMCRFLELVCRKKDWGCESEEIYSAVRRTLWVILMRMWATQILVEMWTINTPKASGGNGESLVVFDWRLFYCITVIN